MNIYLVGGAVRDQLLGLAVDERDWVVVGAQADDLVAQGYRQVGRDFPVFLHPQTGEEYALARTERKSGKGHHGFTVHSDPGVTLEDDLLRRDLTINAMAMDDSGQLIDPYGGRADLDARVLRHASPAFVEDPLRVLRVARFCARLAHMGFRVHPDTLALMSELVASGELDTLPAERTWNEFAKALAAPTPSRFIDVLEDCGAGGWLLPGIENRAEATARLALAASRAGEPETRFAALFYGLDAELAEAVCHHLKPPKRYAELARLAALLGERLGDCRPADAAGQLAVLEQADAFRRPERFQQLLACSEALGTDPASTDFWIRALEACSAIDSRQLVADGLRGEAVGLALRERRETAISELASR